MRFTSLADWLGWLEQSHPKEIDLGLDRVRHIAARLDLLTPHAKVITVAGTNGKGSCVTAIAGLLRAQNFNVGLYTSPHLLHYAERIQINGEPVADELICAAFEKIADACEAPANNAEKISLTYFEYGTLAALELFKQHNVDYAVLEVGLGGRLDAVNIIDADVAVITSIAIDHQDWLGNNRDVIGREKAGILREGQLFVCADQDPPQSIVDISSQLKTNAYFIDRDFSFSVKAKTWNWKGKSNTGGAITFDEMKTPHLPLPSLAAALQVIQLLGISGTHANIEQTLLNLELPGRFQKLMYQGREFILDVAHNPAATHYFSKRLAAEPVAGKTFAIVAMMSDKDRLASLANLVNIVDEWFVLDLAKIPRAASTEALTENLVSLNTIVAQSGDIHELMVKLIAQAQSQDRILVFGSFFTVAAALAYLQPDSHAFRGSQ